MSTTSYVPEMHILQGDLAVAGQVHAVPAGFQVRLDQQHIIQGILGQEDPQPLRVFQHASRRCGLHQSGRAGAGLLDRLQELGALHRFHQVRRHP